MIKKYNDYYVKINEETGFQNVKKIIEEHIKEKGHDFEIFFHQDLDGVFSAISIREYLKRYGLKLIDTHIIQYGGIEFAVKEKRPNSMAVLVDYAHSSPQYTFATDHHDKQSGVVAGQSTHFRKSRSNAETISGVISPSDVFTSTDINLVMTVDSADFLKHEIKPEDIQNSIFSYKRELTPERNRFLMGFVVNRLLLAYKTKRITVTSLDGKNHHINKNLLECLVMDAAPSLYSLFNNLRHYINNAISLEWDRRERSHQSQKKLATPEEITNNLMTYIETRKEYRDTPDGTVKHKDIVWDEDYKIIRQYGIGYVINTGSYDRYVVFKNFPEADFVCTIFPMGLIQVSCNPFKEKLLKEINLGAIAKEVLSSYKYELSNFNIGITDIKRISESEITKMVNKFGEDYSATGFKFSDLIASYPKSIIYRNTQTNKIESLDLTNENDPIVKYVKRWMDVPYDELDDAIKLKLSKLKIPIWDVIIETSGGHPSITNIQSVNYLSCRKDLLKLLFKSEDWLEVMKMIADKFIEVLKSKIDASKNGEVVYDEGGVDLKAGIVSENFEIK